MIEKSMNEWIWQAWLIWIFPLIGAILTPVFAKISHKIRDYCALAFSFLASLMAISMIPYIFEPRLIHNQIEWIFLPNSPILNEIKAGVIIDPLSIIMANIVALIGFLIMVYSIGYMHDDPGLTRYWFFMNLFIGNMLLLVMSDNLIQMLFGWEGVGLCSYALIGYWYSDSEKDWLKCWVGEKPEAYPPSHCGLKAFITTRIGDLFLLIGAFMILSFTGTLNFIELQEGAILKVPTCVLLPATIMLLGGPIGKSAQLPLMEWLPDAMAGPTTVSALIHAATMVKAGVYLVGRIFPIIYFATWHNGIPNEAIVFFYIAAWVGVITAFIAGTQAMVSNEIKKVLAYSTVSQLGYMMLALGVAGLTTSFIIGYTGGVFHLISHAIFKAALFLTAGAVIHACGSRFMYHMGGIKNNMPITFWSMCLAAFSLMGVPFLFSGFWSKDMVLEASIVAGQNWIFILGMVTVAITSFYSMRMIGLTFFGEKSEHLKSLESSGKHVHEAPKVIWIPYLILVIVTIAFGLSGYFMKNWLENTFHEYMRKMLHSSINEFSLSHVESLTMIFSVLMLIIGALPAYYIYIKRKSYADKIISKSFLLKNAWKLLYNRWYINRFYYKTFVYSLISGSNWAFKNIEIHGIDGFNYVLMNTTLRFCNKFRKTHTGILNYNLIGMVIGLIVILIVLTGIALRVI
ncbi:MAG: NADH-quinone oxidoreductase subunit L [Candidatus Bathyarchaeia archaeon]